jgi:hypothetical protein
MNIISLAQRKLRSAWIDLRYGGVILKGDVGSRYSHLGAKNSEHSGYDILPRLFSNEVRTGDVLVDIGCGKGRVLNWWLDQYRNHRIYGIELDPDIAEQTRNRLRRFANVTILTGDACALIPSEGSLFYLFNPFDAEVMQRFIAAVLKNPIVSSGLHRRIVYYNCVHLELFERRPQFSVRYLEPMYSKPSAVIDYTGA